MGYSLQFPLLIAIASATLAAQSVSTPLTPPQPRSLSPSTRPTRAPVYAKLLFAGRYTRDQVVTFAVKDGLLSATWTGNITAEEPCRIDLGETDAEWMVHTPTPPANHPELDRRWLLGRHELRASEDGHYWSVFLHGSTQNPRDVQIVATLDDSRPGSIDTFNIHFSQQPGKIHVECWGREGQESFTMSPVDAADLKQLARNNPELFARYIRPMIHKLTRLELEN